MVKLTDESWEYLSNFEKAKYVMRNSDENFCLLATFIFLVAGVFSRGATSLAWLALTILFVTTSIFIFLNQTKTANLAQDRLEQDERAERAWAERKKKR